MDCPELSIIVATFDEQGTIEQCVRRILAVFPDGCEVLVVDGGSDDTETIARRIAAEDPAVRYVRNHNDRGKGHAIRTGVSQARAQIMAQIDADLQFLPEDLPKVAAPIREGRADVTLGTRFASGSVRLAGSTRWYRTLGNKTASAYASLLSWHRMTDVQAGIKAWTAEAIRAIDLRSDSYSYEAEIPVKALKKGFRVLDVPVTTDARQGGQTKVNVFSNGLPLLWDITRFRLGLK